MAPITPAWFLPTTSAPWPKTKAFPSTSSPLRKCTKDPISSNIFKRISANTGGKSYFAKTWQKQIEAFESIREDLGNSYTVTTTRSPIPTKASAKSASN